jgi:hypothetical protein
MRGKMGKPLEPQGIEDFHRMIHNIYFVLFESF